MARVVNKCGEGGIRTPGAREGTPDFESGPFDHSGTSPFATDTKIQPTPHSTSI